MKYYEELKQKNDILEVARRLGYDGKQSSSTISGNCPAHTSESGSCFVIWKRQQDFHCYHCGKHGDVINLVQLYKECDHFGAVDYLAERAGMPPMSLQGLSPEEMAQRRADWAERRLVEDMLTEAAGYFHAKLNEYAEIKRHLSDHYGFSQEIIDELKIGFAPPKIDELIKHLEAFPDFKGKMTLSGLFTFFKPEEPFDSLFAGRIVFPYWKNGKVVYMAGRVTELTPVMKEAKYIKLRTHDPNDEKKKHISKFIQNEAFMGEDSIRGAKEIIITEGAPDLISALDKGFAAISPVTIRFRSEDNHKLERLTRDATEIYIINDNETSNAGYKGALETAKHLARKGKNVAIVNLPKPDGMDKIDLNEYLKDHSAEELKEIMASAVSVIDTMIALLPRDYIKARPEMVKEIIPIIAWLDESVRGHYVDMLCRQVGTASKHIKTDIANYKKTAKKAESAETIPPDPETERMAEEMAADPQLLKRRIDFINENGVVGERAVLAMYLNAMDSRKLKKKDVGSDALAVKNSGHYGSGKSFSLLKALQLYPAAEYCYITSGSAKSLNYIEGGMAHKALIVAEGFQYQTNNADGSELVYVTRSLLSEGKIVYQTVEKGEDEKMVTVQKVIDGPIAFITTTIMEKLEAQLEDRMFTVHSDESSDQTRGVIKETAEQAKGNKRSPNEKMMAAFQLFHGQMSVVEVIIPYADLISNYIIKKNKVIPIAVRRAFNRSLSVIKSIACAYQYQRNRDDKGRIIADICDYHMAVQIIEQAFKESLGCGAERDQERMKYLDEQGPSKLESLMEYLGVSKSSVSTWATGRVKEGLVIWCNKEGIPFSDDREEQRAKHTGKAFIRVTDNYANISVNGLPTAYEMTGDSEWQPGKSLHYKYDLQLSKMQQVQQSVVVEEISDIEVPELYEELSSIF